MNQRVIQEGGKSNREAMINSSGAIDSHLMYKAVNKYLNIREWEKVVKKNIDIPFPSLAVL